jgi:hypothetical protein
MTKQLISYIIVAILAIVAFNSIRKNTHSVEKQDVVKEVVTIDTMTICKIDTVTIYEPKYITQNVIKHDTLFVIKDSIVYLPITQRYYSEPNLYDLWISGYKPQLDSIKTYNKTEYKTVEKVIEREIVKNKYELYLNGGLNIISKDLMPWIGVSLMTRQRVYYGLNFGYFKGSFVYGIGIGFKLF